MPEPNWTPREDGWFVLEPYPRWDIDAASTRIPGSTFCAFQVWVRPTTRELQITGSDIEDQRVCVDGQYLGGLLSTLRQVAEYFNELDVQPEARPAPPHNDGAAIDLDHADRTVGATHIRLGPLTEAPRT